MKFHGVDPLPRLAGRVPRAGIVAVMALVVLNVVYIGWVDRPAGHPSAAMTRALPADVPTIRLLSEIAQDELKPVAVKPAPQPAEPPLVCQTWGPVNDLAELAEVRARLNDVGHATKVRESVVYDNPDYLVYVGERGKAENARRVLQELKTQSIDSALITRGPYNNTLSVGVFSRADRANRQRERVAKLGYEVGIEEIGRSYTVYHLEAHVPSGFELPMGASGPCAEIAQAH